MDHKPAGYTALGKTPSPACPRCGHHPQDGHHITFECLAYCTTQRSKDHLLGGPGPTPLAQDRRIRRGRGRGRARGPYRILCVLIHPASLRTPSAHHVFSLTFASASFCTLCAGPIRLHLDAGLQQSWLHHIGKAEARDCPCGHPLQDGHHLGFHRTQARRALLQ